LTEFRKKVETKTNFPNVFRIVSLLFIILLITHWNACFYFMISNHIGISTDQFVLSATLEQGILGQYTSCFFWSTLALTTISNFSNAILPIEMIYVTFTYLIGILILATIFGNASTIVANLDKRKNEFQQKVDSVKRYMQMRKVEKNLQTHVLDWFNYSWANSKGADENEIITKLLPANLQVEISINIHLEALKRVHIFQDCEPGLLEELVLKLKLQMFSPSDYVCRKGDIGREMYFIKRGKLVVVSDDGKTVFVNLSEGSYFGEISILDIPGNRTGNRRTANVVSIGFSDLFCLTKKDLWDVLNDYPLTKKILIEKGKDLLRKDNLLDENQIEETERIEKLNNSLNEKLFVLKDLIDSTETRLARLIGEHEANMSKIKARIDSLKINTKLSVKNDLVCMYESCV
jgi:cyclic nucleotide gated channel alpha 3